MQTFTTAEHLPPKSTFPGKAILIIILLSALAYAVSVYYASPPPDYLRENRLKMEKNSGKNGKHANQKAREKAEQEFQKVKEELQQWEKKPNKTPDDKDFIKKLRKQLERLRQKKDFGGENHSQKYKGN